MKEVVAALIRKDGKLLICQRPEGKACGGLWEFAGGKVEAGESKEEALIRECEEELGITVTVGRIFTETEYEYPQMAIHLTLFEAQIAKGHPVQKEHQALRWISPADILQYAFCPADEIFLPDLQKL